jgi:hypothetical protein
MFQAGGRSLGEAFSTWAMRHLREHPDEGASAALALEMRLPSLFGRRVSPPGLGQVGLAEDARTGSFPADLSELVYAARAVRRHLTARAWACGALELTGLESLAQVARRPGPGPWSFVARRRVGGYEVQPVSPALAELLRKLSLVPQPVSAVPPGLLAEAQGRGLLRLGG